MPVLHLNVSGPPKHVLHLDISADACATPVVSTPQGPELHLDFSV